MSTNKSYRNASIGLALFGVGCALLSVWFEPRPAAIALAGGISALAIAGSCLPMAYRD